MHDAHITSHSQMFIIYLYTVVSVLCAYFMRRKTELLQMFIVVLSIDIDRPTLEETSALLFKS